MGTYRIVQKTAEGTVVEVDAGGFYYTKRAHILLKGISTYEPEDRPPHRRREVRHSWLAERDLYYRLARDELYFRRIL